MKKILALVIITLVSFSVQADQTDQLSLAIGAIGKHYVAPKKIDTKKLFESAINEIEKEIPESLIKMSKRSTDVTVGIAKKKFGAPPNSLYSIPHKLKPIIEFIEQHREHYPDELTTEEAALTGLADALDPHTSYLPPKVFKEFKVGTQGKFGGLGIVISIRDGQLTVIAPLDNTPASRAGIKTGDKIIQINDESTINMSLTEAVNLMRGKVGTKLRITTTRKGASKPNEMTITRAVINIESVKHQVYNYKEKKYAFFQVKNFQANTVDDFNKALSEMNKNGKLDGLILDLRNNTGGLLNQAIELSDRFLKEGVIVSTVMARKKVIERAEAHDTPDDITLPVVVIVNQGSASASEIVAGALKFNKRAIVIGNRSFGKGTVQTIFPLTRDSALKLTIAQYLAAGRYPIQQIGIVPDVKLIPISITKDQFDISENEFSSEKKLDHSFININQQTEKPLLTISYLSPKKDSEEKDEIKYETTLNIETDFVAKVAADIIFETKSFINSESLKTAARIVYSKVNASEDAKITAELAKNGINWEKGYVLLPSHAPIKINTRFLNSDGKVVSKLVAGDEYKFEVMVKNSWVKSIPRILAVLREPDYTGGEEHEIVFGMIPANATIKKTIPISFKKAVPKQLAELKISLKSNSKELIQNQNVNAILEPANEPKFAFEYKIKGQLGKKSTSMITNIFNVGKGSTSENAVAVIYNDCEDDIYIEKGRNALKNLKSQKNETVKFKFHLKTQDPPPNCYMRLAIADPDFFKFTSFRIALTSAGLIPPPENKYVPPVINVLEIPLTTNQSKIEISGSFTATQKAKDWMIYLNQEKIAYQQNSKETKVMPIAYQVSLKKGRNVITLITRDGFDLVDSKELVILRKD